MAGELGLLCMDLAEIQGDEKTKHSISMVAGPPEFHGLLVGMSNSANMMPDFTSWFEIAKDPPLGYLGVQGGADLGTPWLSRSRDTSSLTAPSSASAEARSSRTRRSSQVLRCSSENHECIRVDIFCLPT